jgi:hypothetical protein
LAREDGRYDGDFGGGSWKWCVDGVSSYSQSSKTQQLTEKHRYASMPFDNIKTRMQSIGNKYTRMTSCALHMAKTEGVKVFWKATTPRLVRLTLSSSITFMVYDKAVGIMNGLTAPELSTVKQLA